jgi:hypothetical protein
MPDRQQRRVIVRRVKVKSKKVVSSKESGFFDFCTWRLTLARVKLYLYYILKTVFYGVD